MKTPYIFSLAAGAALVLASLTGCKDMMTTETGTYIPAADGRMLTKADSLYSAIGILTQMQTLGERYVLLGELRGDMVNPTPSAPFSMQEVAQFQVSADNEYLDRRPYYSVINNCNYALSHIDKDITEGTRRPMLGEYAAIAAMRAWTYLQMGLTFGSAKYIEEPILSLEASEAEYPELPLDALVQKLIPTLEPFTDVEMPSYGNIDGYDSHRFFIDPRLMLADLLLYDNQYERAAELYYLYIDKTRCTLSVDNGNRWTRSTQTASEVSGGNIQAYANEALSFIPYSSDASELHPDLVNLTYSSSPRLLPAEWWINAMAQATHFHADEMRLLTISAFLQGDLRARFSLRSGTEEVASAIGTAGRTGSAGPSLITKYYLNGNEASWLTNPSNQLFDTENPVRISRFVATYRIPQVYLRYAEAVNRAGKPNLAFAVMKYGLTPETMADTLRVDSLELAEPWTDFSAVNLPDNCGTAMRGRGLGVRLPGSDFVIPQLASLQDSIRFVETELLREEAAETSFEGSRFFDILRMSHHRADHPRLAAQTISRRAENPQALEQKLQNIDNYWIK